MAKKAKNEQNSPQPELASAYIFSFPLLKSLRYFEWSAVAIILIADFCHRQLSQGKPHAWDSFVPFVISMALLAWIQSFNPSRCGRGKCMFLLISEVLVVVFASMTGACGPLYFFTVLICAKAVLLLGMRSAVVIVLINVAILGLLMIACTKIFEKQGIDYALCATDCTLQLALFGMVYTLVVFIARAIVREAETRKRVEELALENEVLSKEIERNRIARDLHDTLGHSLVSLGLQLELIQEFRSRDQDKANKALLTARELTDHLITEVRQTVQAIRSPTFDLDTSLKELVQQVHQNNKLSVNLNCDVNVLPNRVGHELFCITKECLTNVQKHASASNVKIDVQQKPDHVELSIADDGTGFAKSQPPSGFGLLNIQERVRILAGQLSLESSPETGTQIVVRIPV